MNKVLRQGRNVLVIIMLFIQVNTYAQNGVYNVKDYGAKGDGKTLDTESIQAAIDKCYNAGGGTVLLPAGKYLSGCVILKSNIAFHIGAGAVLLGSNNKNDYKIKVPSFESRSKNLFVNRSIIYAEKAENISVTGNGIIYGQGTHNNYSKTYPQKDRPFIARFTECRNVVIRDVSMLESANWTCYLLGCDGVLVDGLKIKNSIRANRDGLDIDCCKDVTVANCRIFTMDDAIVLKSTGPATTRNINIANCNVSSHASGIKIGTDSSSDFDNITISNCVITNIPVNPGIALMVVDGGAIKNVLINNIVMDSVNIPFMIRLGNRARPYKNGLPTPEVGSIRNISINNVIATNAMQTSHITGLNKKKLENISLGNITVHYRKKYEGEAMAYNKVPLKEDGYPSGQLYGKNLPASAFYFRNIEGLKLNDINIRFFEKDSRVPLVFDRVKDLQLLNSQAILLTKTPFLYLRNMQNCIVDNCTNHGSSSYLAVTEKGNCSNIHVNPDKLWENQKVVNSVPVLLDKTYDDINGYSNHIFPNNSIINGLYCYPLKNGTVVIKLKAERGKAFKLLVLNYSQGQAETILFTIGDQEYPLNISNKNWGWSAINVQKICNEDTVTVKISTEKTTSSLVYIAKIALIPVPVTD